MPWLRMRGTIPFQYLSSSTTPQPIPLLPYNTSPLPQYLSNTSPPPQYLSNTSPPPHAFTLSTDAVPSSNSKSRFICNMHLPCNCTWMWLLVLKTRAFLPFVGILRGCTVHSVTRNILPLGCISRHRLLVPKVFVRNVA